ncbi:MAG: cell division protein ZapA [Candidatus Contendobacter sp.]|nr:cell division protein ZapA [Candidatus Contendobacter sp.]MDS4059466.1 cell division protein ZapA [Candidatus Contendobacter sp.]
MSQKTISVAVHVAGCDYRFACSPAEREELLEAAYHLDQKMREIRDHSGKSLALESVAMMAALNLSHELLRQQRQATEMEALLNRRLQVLSRKVDMALSQLTLGEV